MDTNQNIDKNKFKIPENYFAELEANVISKTINTPSENRSRLRILRPYFAVAASICLLGLIWFLLAKPIPVNYTAEAKSEPTEQLAELDAALYESLLTIGDSGDETLEAIADFLIELEDF